MTSFAAKPSRNFDKLNPYWNDRNRRQNPIFVTMVQQQLNDLLKIRGYVLLNDALRMLGFPVTVEGGMIGWLRDSDPSEGDGYIHFGVWDEGLVRGKDWIQGNVEVLPIRFNVDRSPYSLTSRVKKLRAEGRL